jgi:hypothetical protein
MMTATPKTALVLDILTHGLSPGTSRRIDLTNGAFMPLSVECLAENLFSTTHYFEQNGDLMPDPDVTWWKSPSGAWVPLSIQHSTGHFTEAVELEGGKPVRYRPRALKDLINFAAMWLSVNFVQQQGGLKAIRAACANPSVQRHR